MNDRDVALYGHIIRAKAQVYGLVYAAARAAGESHERAVIQATTSADDFYSNPKNRIPKRW